MRTFCSLSASFAASILFAGCSFFDPSLYQDEQLEDFPVADSCDGPVPVPVVAETFHGIVDLSGNRDEFNNLGSCVDNARTPGPDGFIAVPMRVGEKWHFHAKVIDGVGDPALYVLDSCDARSCQFGAGIDICGSGIDEHFSFISPRDTTYIVGLDDKGLGGGRYDLLVLHATCGDGNAEHSEGCDDGNRVPGDGCDEGCRFELAAAADEHEPNDDFTGANRPILTSGAGSVLGLLEGRCDPDFFAVQVPEGGSVSVQMTTRAGSACAESSPASLLELVDQGGLDALGAGANPAGSGCPAIDGEAFAAGLPAGVYYLRLTSPDADTSLPYKLSIQVVDAP
ncbi:MAG: hypothetical protein GXP55_26230 [Deltaproteobacteria bacterium]|nr:hypothetical protein [Deltaproteobacteria bacterium]